MRTSARFLVYVTEMALLLGCAYASTAIIDAGDGDSTTDTLFTIVTGLPGLAFGWLLLTRVIRPATRRWLDPEQG